MQRRSARKEEEIEINLTPMLDIVFIMLIFFIVTSTFVKEAGIEVVRPEAYTAQDRARANIMVAINEAGQIWIQKQQVDLAAVRSTIERLYAENPQGSIVIQADRKSKSGLVVSVMDQIRNAGVTNVAIAAKRPGQ